LLEPVIRLFEQAISESRLKPLGVQTLLTMSFGAVSSLAKLYIFKKMSVDDRVIQKELDAVWDMIKI